MTLGHSPCVVQSDEARYCLLFYSFPLYDPSLGQLSSLPCSQDMAKSTHFTAPWIKSVITDQAGTVLSTSGYVYTYDSKEVTGERVGGEEVDRKEIYSYESERVE